MRRNHGQRGMNAGSGLLGEGPGMGTGMKRMMAGVGGGSLLGSAPNRAQQPRGLLERPDLGAGLREQQNMPRGILKRPDLREGQGYNHGGRMEQPTDPGYYDETGGGYVEEHRAYQHDQQEYEDPNAGVYDRGVQEPYGHDQYDTREQDYGYNYNNNQQPPDLYQNPAVNQRGLLEEPPVRGSLMGQPQRLHEDQGYRHEELGMRHDERGMRHEDRGLRQQDPGLRHEDRGLRQQDPGLRLEDRGLRQQDPGLRQRQTGGFEDRGLLEAPVEDRGFLRRPEDQRGMMQQSRDQHGQPNRHRGLLDPPRDQGGLLDPPRERGFVEAAHERHGLMERPELDRHAEQHGLLDYPRDQQRGLMPEPRGLMPEPPSLMGLSEPPRPPVALMDVRSEPRGLMDTPVEPTRLMDPGREPRSLMEKAMSQRGLMDPPRENRGARDQREQRGLLDFPREQRSPMSPKQQKGKNRPRTKQSELMEKADLQMKLLQQEKMREMEQIEQMTLLKTQQQALLMQHQQQHLQQVQQQQQIQQQLQIKQQMQQAEMIMNASKGQPRSGGIPSLLDMPTRGKTALGKRPNAPARSPVRGSDNKRARTGPADRRDRRPSLPGRKDSSRDRLGGRRNDRNRRGRRLSRNTSPDRKKQDRKDSGPRSSSSKKTTPGKDRIDRGKERRNDRGKDKNEKEKKEKDEKDTNKDLPKTEVTVTMSQEYDPAEPTDDVIVIEDEKVVKKDESSSAEKIDVEGTDEKKDDKQTDGQKQKEISLTVTVNKKGRSVNDADQKDAKKVTKEKMYKCNVCSVECYDEASFGRHMNGKKHNEKMKIVMSSTSQQAVLIKSRLQAEEHLRSIEAQKRSPGKHTTLGPSGSVKPKGKALESNCKVCKKTFTGAYKDHKGTPDHKAREDRSKAGCKICNVSTFNTYQDFVKHLQSVWHLKKLKQESWPECKLCDQKFKSPRKFVQHCKTDHHIQNKKKLNIEDDDEELSELVTLDTIGFEDDANAERKEKDMESSPFLKPFPVNTSTPKPSLKGEAVTPVKAEEEDTVIPERYDSSIAVGQKYVVPVSGFFCKLCHKFYNNEAAAKVAHCQSETHYDKLKKAIAAKRAKMEDKAKKMEIDQPQFGNGTQSNDKSIDTSQTSTVENGDQSTDDVGNMEEPSAYETADEHQDSTVNAEDVSQDSQNLSNDQDEGCITIEDDDEGESTVYDSESREGSQGSQDDEADDKINSTVEVKQQRGRRGGGVARGSTRARRGRK